MFGDGQYFGDERTAKLYAEDMLDSGAVIRAALRPGARVINYKELMKMVSQEHIGYGKSTSMATVYARSLGYDAIADNARGQTGFITVINRDALVISSNIRRFKDGNYVS